MTATELWLIPATTIVIASLTLWLLARFKASGHDIDAYQRWYKRYRKVQQKKQANLEDLVQYANEQKRKGSMR